MQQINLYHPSLRKKEQIISFSHLAKGSLGLFVFLGLLQSYTVFQTYSLKNKIENNTVLLKQNKIRLNKLHASLPKVKKDHALPSQLSQIENNVIKKQNVINILSNQTLGNTNGFTKQFEGLARQAIDGLWLTKLHFLQGGTILDIEGKSNQPALVPKYLQALSKEKIFIGTEFTSFIIQHPEKENALVFRINNIRNAANENKVELSRR